MVKKIKRSNLILLFKKGIFLFACFLLVLPSVALRAADSVCGDNFKQIGNTCIPTNTGLADPEGGILTILSNFFKWLMVVFTVLAVMAFVISGIQYLLSSGDEDLAKKAKNNAKNALIGIIVGLSGYLIVIAISKVLTATSLF